MEKRASQGNRSWTSVLFLSYNAKINAWLPYNIFSEAHLENISKVFPFQKERIMEVVILFGQLRQFECVRMAPIWGRTTVELLIYKADNTSVL